MFKKLISNLPFNPNLASHVVFYAKRLKKEETTRRFGLGFVALAFFVQIFLSISPPQNTLATSNNDIIYGGGSKSQMAQSVRNNQDRLHKDLQAIFNYYGVTADDIANGQQTTVSTVGPNNYYSIGRTHRDGGDITVPIQGTQTPIYSRKLEGWARKSWDAVKIPNREIWVLNDCGNIVTKGNYTPETPTQPSADLQIAKTNKPTGDVKPGEIIEYTLAFANHGGNAAFFSVNDELPSELTYVDSQFGNWAVEVNGNRIKWHNNQPPFYAFGNTDTFGTPGFITVRARVNESVASGTTVCNRAWLQDVSTTDKQIRNWGEAKACNTVVVLCPNGQPLKPGGTCEEPPKPVDQEVACSYLKIIKEIDRTKRTFEAESKTVGGAKITSYTYNFGDETGAVTVPTTSLRSTIEHDFKVAGTYNVSVSVDSSLGFVTSTACKIQVSVKPEPQDLSPILSLKKTAKNITQNINDANGTTANGGDEIEYTLTTTNMGNGAAQNTQLRSEDLGDILEYADIVSGTIGDGVFDATKNQLSWPEKVTIQPGAQVAKTFRIKVKQPIPQTPASKSDTRSFDLVMFNEYGNDVSIKLPGSPAKQIEITTTTIPQTGPGTGAFVSTLFLMFAAYLYARSRTMKHELQIIKNEYVTGGSNV